MNWSDEHYVKRVLPEVKSPGFYQPLPLWGHQTDGSFILEEDREHWIYFIQGDDGGPIKIGRSCRHVEARLDSLQAGYPFGLLRFVGLMRGHRSLENQLHAQFRSIRLVREWFAPAPILLDFVVALPASEMPPDVRRRPRGP